MRNPGVRGPRVRGRVRRRRSCAAPGLPPPPSAQPCLRGDGRQVLEAACAQAGVPHKGQAPMTAGPGPPTPRSARAPRRLLGPEASPRALSLGIPRALLRPGRRGARLCTRVSDRPGTCSAPGVSGRGWETLVGSADLAVKELVGRPPGQHYKQNRKRGGETGPHARLAGRRAAAAAPPQNSEHRAPWDPGLPPLLGIDPNELKTDMKGYLYVYIHGSRIPPDS